MKTPYIICHDIDNKKYKILPKDLNFRPTVYGLIFKGDKILLSKQGNGYNFPGGGVEKGELLENALKREVWEETGIKIKPGPPIKATEDFFISIENKRRLHCVVIYYICTNPTGKISTKNFTGYERTFLSAAEWVDLKDIKKLRFENAVDSPKLISEAYKMFARIK